MAAWRDPFGGVGDQENLFAGEGGPRVPGAGAMFERFVMPPFSVLNANGGEWRKRKARWLGLGFEGAAGRKDDLCFSGWDASRPEYSWIGGLTNTSVFDPVLCELSYRWFCPAGGTVLDPFSGGVTRGLVAAALGLDYVGVDIRDEQVEENLLQWCAIGAPDWGCPVWVVGDGSHPAEAASGEYDFLYTCPPYWNLEHYSDDPADLSNMGWAEFGERYTAGIVEACGLLCPDRFAAYVVGEVRDPDLRGCYRSLLALTVAAFAEAGCGLYNEAVFVAATGSLPVRASRTFSVSRKLGNQHQFLLVFVKGDPKRAHAACGEVAAFDYDEVPKELVQTKTALKEWA
jgi:hypothetical protein